MSSESKKNIVSRSSSDDNHVISSVQLQNFVHGKEKFPDKNIMLDEIESFLAAQRVPDDRRARLVVAIHDLIAKARDEVVTPRADTALEGRERWKRADGRQRRGESPVMFVKKVYPDREALGLSMLDIKGADPELYMALARWKVRNRHDPELADLRLPTKAEKNDRLIANRSADEVLAGVRKGLDRNLYAVAKMRQLRAMRKNNE